VDLFPQEITRVLLNLISNGFYAATKRAEADGGGYDPMLVAATKSLGDQVEIRIRDNGTLSGANLDPKNRRARAPGLVCPSVTISSSSNMPAGSTSTANQANSPNSGSLCRGRQPYWRKAEDEHESSCSSGR
jgi:hypothetical protein